MKNLPQFPVTVVGGCLAPGWFYRHRKIDRKVDKGYSMIETMKNKIERIVEQACAADTNIFGYGIWTHHILKVVQNAKRLSLLFDAHPEIVELAALLHDYASIKDKALYAHHHIHSPIEAEKLLKRFGYPEEKREAVKQAIATHRASVKVEHRSAEAECLANADAMSHIEEVPSLLYLAYVHHGMEINEGRMWVKAKLQRSWQKLRRDVQDIIRDKYEAALKVL